LGIPIENTGFFAYCSQGREKMTDSTGRERAIAQLSGVAAKFP
jgi:hypothetical protein